jgi:hypothetical protein
MLYEVNMASKQNVRNLGKEGKGFQIRPNWLKISQFLTISYH